MIHPLFVQIFSDPYILWFIILLFGISLVCVEMARQNAIEVMNNSLTNVKGLEQNIQTLKLIVNDKNEVINELGEDITAADDLLKQLDISLKNERAAYTDLDQRHQDMLNSADSKRVEDAIYADNLNEEIDQLRYALADKSQDEPNVTVTELQDEVERLKAELQKTKSSQRRKSRKGKKAVRPDWANLIPKYQSDNPDATKAQAIRDLNIGSPNTLNKYWVDNPSSPVG